MSKNTFGKNLKKLRIKANLTQEEVARYLQVSRQSISKWEQDIALPNIIFIVPLASILNCTLDELFNIKKES